MRQGGATVGVLAYGTKLENAGKKTKNIRDVNFGGGGGGPPAEVMKNEIKGKEGGEEP